MSSPLSLQQPNISSTSSSQHAMAALPEGQTIYSSSKLFTDFTLCETIYLIHWRVVWITILQCLQCRKNCKKQNIDRLHLQYLEEQESPYCPSPLMKILLHGLLLSMPFSVEYMTQNHVAAHVPAPCSKRILHPLLRRLACTMNFVWLVWFEPLANT